MIRLLDKDIADIDNPQPAEILHTFKCGDKHGFAEAAPPRTHIRHDYYWGTRSESAIIGGIGGREMVVNCWMSDAELVSRTHLDNYIREVERFTTTNGILEITKPLVPSGQDRELYYNVIFVEIARVPKNDQRIGVILPSLVAPPIGPDGPYWLDCNLKFYQVKLNEESQNVPNPQP